ncbi:hypothetical protein JCM6882_001027 [Rhodosporidiobolus microsporus]
MHYSPQIALAQTTIAIFLLAFLIYWTILYDRYAHIKVFRVNFRREMEVPGRRSREVFKRLMIYFYLIGLPLFCIQGSWYAWIKYEVGFYPANDTGNPVDYHEWPSRYRAHIGPLQILFAIAWAAEIIVHLEELMFFLHLVNMTATSRPWFRSWHFRITVFGAVSAFGACLGVVGGYWSNPLRGEAVLLLVASTFIVFTSIAFFRVMYIFPRFLAELRVGGGTTEVLIRLKGWHELNKIRIPARLLFGVPLFILAIDGCTEDTLLNRHIVWVDTLTFIALFGFAVQAVITLLIFLPRSWAYELGVGQESTSSFESPVFASPGPRRPLDLGSPRRPLLSSRRAPYMSTPRYRFPHAPAAGEAGASTTDTLHISYSDWPSPPGTANKEGGMHPPDRPPFSPSSLERQQQHGQPEIPSFVEHLYPPAVPPPPARSGGDLSRPPLNFLDTSSSSTSRVFLGENDVDAAGDGGAPLPGVVVTRETAVAVSPAPGTDQDGEETVGAEEKGRKSEAGASASGEGGTRRVRVEHAQPVEGHDVEGRMVQVGVGRLAPESWRRYTSPIEIV